eukprot:SAG31_NODE_146_length_22601_cov_56.529192_9_plen_234_part_00
MYSAQRSDRRTSRQPSSWRSECHSAAARPHKSSGAPYSSKAGNCGTSGELFGWAANQSAAVTMRARRNALSWSGAANRHAILTSPLLTPSRRSHWLVAGWSCKDSIETCVLSASVFVNTTEDQTPPEPKSSHAPACRQLKSRRDMRQPLQLLLPSGPHHVSAVELAVAALYLTPVPIRRRSQIETSPAIPLGSQVALDYCYCRQLLRASCHLLRLPPVRGEGRNESQPHLCLS